MLLSDGIIAMKACLEMFGDAHFAFVTTKDGNPAVELKDVDTANNNSVIPSEVEGPHNPTEDEILEEILRFNARFPTKDIYIPSRN